MADISYNRHRLPSPTPAEQQLHGWWWLWFIPHRSTVHCRSPPDKVLFCFHNITKDTSQHWAWRSWWIGLRCAQATDGWPYITFLMSALTITVCLYIHRGKYNSSNVSVATENRSISWDSHNSHVYMPLPEISESVSASIIHGQGIGDGTGALAGRQCAVSRWGLNS